MLSTVAVNTRAHDFGVILREYPLGKFLVVELLSQWEPEAKICDAKIAL